MRIDILTPISEIVSGIQEYEEYGEHEEAALLALRYAMAAECHDLYPVTWEAAKYHLDRLDVASEVVDDALEIFDRIEYDLGAEWSKILDTEGKDRFDAVRSALVNIGITEDLDGDIEEVIDWYVNDDVDLHAVYLLSALLGG